MFSKIKPSYFILILLFLIQSAIAQDLEIYHKKINDNFRLPVIDSTMTYEEFSLLSTRLRMREMIYAVLIPGYVHNKIGEKTVARKIFICRLVGYGLLAYVYTDASDFFTRTSTLVFNDYLDGNGKRQLLFYGGIAISLGSYLFDWIYGEKMLFDKQTRIRYKYSLKLTTTMINDGRKYIPFWGIKTEF